MSYVLAMRRSLHLVLAMLIGLSLTGSIGFAQTMASASEPCHTHATHAMEGHQHHVDKRLAACVQCLCCLADPAAQPARSDNVGQSAAQIVFYAAAPIEQPSRQIHPEPDPPRPIA